jgi:hypothetical protein
LKLRRTGLTWTQTSSVNHLKKDRPDTHSIMSPQSAPLTATHSVTGRASAAESPPSSTTSTMRIGAVELSLVLLSSLSLPLFSDFSAVFPTLPKFSFSKPVSRLPSCNFPSCPFHFLETSPRVADLYIFMFSPSGNSSASRVGRVSNRQKLIHDLVALYTRFPYCS